VTNLYIVESVRRHYLDEYRGIVTQTLPPADGEFALPPGPGLGVDLCPEVFAREDVQVEWGRLPACGGLSGRLPS
jgi:L-alanine-DL-glutamate epimerase-like enolase superfamily enzyme